MSTVKDDSIKFRVNKQLKSDFKQYTEDNNTNMSEIFTQYMTEILKKDKFKKENIEKITQRSAETEIKINNLKLEFESQKEKRKKKKLISVWSRFLKAFEKKKCILEK